MDLTTAKTVATAAWPPRTKEAAAGRLVPLITPTEVRFLHLLGLPLVSAMPHPVTKQRQEVTDAIIDALIRRAIEQVEVDTGITILPTEYSERQPFDRNHFEFWGHMQLSRRPAWSVGKIVWEAPDGNTLFTWPLDWVDTGKLYRGQIAIVPVALAQNSTGLVAPIPGTGSAFLNVISMQVRFIPAFFTVDYATGFPDGMVPQIFNELIGARVAIEILGMLGATFGPVTSTSTGIDGFSQSVGTGGSTVFVQRITELQEKYDRIKGRVKSIFGNQIVVGTV
jgi:hypothetical protein